MKRRYISDFILFLLVFNTFCFAESNGERLFKENKPEESIPFLEEEITAGTASAQAYNFLGLAYYQLGEYEKSAEVFAKGLKVSGTNKKVLSYNQGNSYYLMQNYNEAVKSFDLAIVMDSSFSDAMLNRANSYLMLRDFKKAKVDYQKYLELEPENSQKESIVALLALLDNQIVRQEEEEKLAAIEAARIAEEEKKLQEELERQRLEEERLAEEARKERERLEEEARKERERLEEEARIAREKEEAEKRKIEEEQRKIEEEKKAIEAERRRKMLEDVANSLQDTSSTNMTAGSEEILDYDFESELD
ncbi:MAG: tetratricopeptide repeat protein [Treponema sp.]|nr:tetratricopeptide repeat protein [Treponema sp.]